MSADGRRRSTMPTTTYRTLVPVALRLSANSSSYDRYQICAIDRRDLMVRLVFAIVRALEYYGIFVYNDCIRPPTAPFWPVPDRQRVGSDIP